MVNVTFNLDTIGNSEAGRKGALISGGGGSYRYTNAAFGTKCPAYGGVPILWNILLKMR